MADKISVKEDILKNGKFSHYYEYNNLLVTYSIAPSRTTDFYHQFLSENFDVKEHASHVLQGSIVSEQLSKLAEGGTFKICCDEM